jgi:hypothetical protein
VTDLPLRAAALDALRDPARFAKVFLGADLWAKQEEILRAVATKPRTAVKACHSSGKTRVAAIAALWWITRFPDGIVLTTAPTWTQVERLLWGDIRKVLAQARISYPKPNQTSLDLTREKGSPNYAMGLSTNEGVRFQGFHGKMLVIIDEAPGVDADIWEAIDGARAGGDVRVLALGNPTEPGGPFHRAFTDARDSWETITISAFDTPNLAGLTLDDVLTMEPDALDVAPRPYLTLRRWVRETYREYGPESAYVQARVFAEFPTQSEDALISLGWIEAATRRTVTATDDCTAGIDVAGPGEDETVLIVRAGGAIVHEQAWPEADPRGPLLAALAPYRGRLRTVNVDTAGIGYYLARHLEDQGLPVRDVNVGESPTDLERWKNKKAQHYDGLRCRFRDGDIGGPMSAKLVSQLASIRYKHTGRNQLEIESKDKARERGVRSPDRAEALMLAFAEDGVGAALLGWLDLKAEQARQAQEGKAA